MSAMNNRNIRPSYRYRGPSPHGVRQNGIGPPMRGHGGPMQAMGPRPPFRGMHAPMRHYRPQMRSGGPHMHQRPMCPNNTNNEGCSRRKRTHNVDLSRPWVNDTLKADFAVKDTLFQKARSSNHEVDWSIFKEQKDKCMHMYSVLKNEYVGQHPDEVVSANEEPDEYVCEACDRAFDDERPYRAHLSEHQTCGIDGCKFNAHELLVLAHIKMQHSSGLYDKIRNISTSEDIEKWRAERRKNYPSKANIEQRYKQQAEMLKRGERIGPNKDRFGRNRKEKQQNKEVMKKKKKRRKVAPKKEKTAVSLIDEKADWNGTMFPFRGTSSLDEGEENEESDEFSDDEWEQQKDTPVEEVKLNNALGALMGAYNSDDTDSDTADGQHLKKPVFPVAIQGSSTGKTERHVEETMKKKHESDDDDKITEEKILKAPVSLPDKATEEKLTENRKRPIPISEITPDDVPVPPRKVLKLKNKVPPVVRTFNRRPTLLQKLLDKEIRHERNIILQCVRYVVNNNFFDKPGSSSS